MFKCPKEYSSPAPEIHRNHTGNGKWACFQHVSKLWSCMSHLCHGWISPSNLLIFGRFAFVLCSGGVSFKMALPSAKCLWLDFQILISSTSFTHCLIHIHTHALLNLDSKMSHSFHSLHRCLLLAFSPRAFGRGWAHSCFLLWRIGLNLPTSFTVFPLPHPSLPVFLHFYLSPSNPHVSLTYPEQCST